MDEYLAARAIVEKHGRDSLSPFVLRPDKGFHFAAGGVLAYRLIGRTAVISGDPIAPDGAARRVLASFLELARGRRWQVVLWGASERHLQDYRSLGLHSLRAGEEAFVDPKEFTLAGRRVRKLRQSVHRLHRRGWTVTVFQGVELDTRLIAEIASFESAWKAEQPRLLGFAMGFGAFDPVVLPDDLYLLGRSPDGELRAVMHFVAHCGNLSLDSMHRVGETPNGLNEALVCRALEVARERGVTEVSLNYAGLGHIVREQDSSRLVRPLRPLLLGLLRRRFQMERLVRFNEKFSPDWRPRFLVYRSRAGLPLAALRILQAEGYLDEPKRPSPPARGGSPARAARANARG